MSTSRTVLITGGNRGLGLAIARAFQKRKHRVAVTYRDTQPPDGTYGVRCDVTVPDDVEKAFAEVERELGQVEILVSNAGITDDVLLLRMTEERFSRVIDANLAGAYRVAKRAVPGMLRAGWGRMIFVSSVAAVRGAPGQVNYAASKAGLTGMARAIARELGTRDITANVIMPGFIPTDITDALPEQLRREALAQIPAGRYGEPSEVAEAAVFLASEEASYITGALLPVDGGLGMGMLPNSGVDVHVYRVRRPMRAERG
jgi:beta-ketoacyl ACP reductase